MKKNTFYKVCLKHCDNGCVSYYSALFYCNPKISIEYKIGEWVYPKIKGSNLMVFDSVESAQSCITNNRWINCSIFECEVQKPSKKGLFTSPIWAPFEKMAKLRLNKKKYKHLDNEMYVPPKGTIFCNAVKLIKMVS